LLLWTGNAIALAEPADSRRRVSREARPEPKDYLERR
jgi:hypothetical protein